MSLLFLTAGLAVSAAQTVSAKRGATVRRLRQAPETPALEPAAGLF
jgi:hypothetical protein